MSANRPFRFGVQGDTHPSTWLEHVSRAEALGYDVISVGEHVFTDLAPITALATAAVASSKIRLGTLTFGNDFNNPVMLAREIASIDAVSGGRVEFGIGSGWLDVDYDRYGVPLDPPGTRIDRLFEAVRLMKAAFTQDKVDHTGEHYSVKGFSLSPKPLQRPHPPLAIGGGGRRVLRFAAREADIVGINQRGTADGGVDFSSLSPEATAEKVGWVRDAAGDRFDSLELHMLMLRVAITDDPEMAARQVLDDFEAFGVKEALTVADVLSLPNVLIGTEEEIVGSIHQLREEYAISYISVFTKSMEDFAPIAARLAGS